MTAETDLTLSAWLLQRLDEDEGAARAAIEGPWNSTDDYQVVAGYGSANDGDTVALGSPGVVGAVQARRNTDFIARNDPAHVLVTVAAHRRIVELHAEQGALTDALVNGDTSPQGLSRLWAASVAMGILEVVVQEIAAAYSDAEGYRDEWSP
jgi:hypothetical protein